jgi:carboxymethylenebutenolidase
MARVGELRKSLNADAIARDARAYAEFLYARPEVKTYKLGAVGYCMGGTNAVRAAIAVPDKIGAAASFHGGNLVTDARPRRISCSASRWKTAPCRPKRSRS